MNDHAEVFTQLMFTDYSTVAQIAPSGAFYGTTFTTNCGNPFLSAAQRTTFACTAGDVAANAPRNFLLGRRNVEGGGRQDDLRYQSYRGVVGVRGQFDDAWSYDVAGQYSRVQLSRIYRNDFSTTRIGRALDVVNVGGTPTCRSVVDGTDPNCVPYNVFSIGGVTPEALDYLQTPGVQSGSTTQQIVTASVAGDLGGYGVKTPWSTNGLQVAFGAEYRRDELVSETDLAFSTGDLAGQGGPTIGLSGASEVYDLFMEARMPLVEDMPGAKLLAVEAAYRFSDYGSGLNTDTYKLAADWSPVEDVRFRASYQRAVRAPNVIELFTAQGLGLFDIDGDPCGDTASTGVRKASLAACVATGVPVAKYGSSDLDSPAGQFNFFGGGNPDLVPETADTYTYGLVFTPSFFSGLTVSVDYFNIEVADRIDTFGADNTLSACYFGNVTEACNRINRNALGDFWTQGGFVEDFNINTGGLETSGIDVLASYSLDLGDYGGLNFNLVGTWLEKLYTDPGDGATKYDCVGYYGNQCGIPNPEWRHRVRVAYDTPISGLNLAATWRYYGEVDLFGLDASASGGPGPVKGRVDSHFDAEHYFDLYASWKATDSASFRIGVNNVFDNDPQLSASVGTTGNGNTYPQTYDAFGRYVFMGFTLDF